MPFKPTRLVKEPSCESTLVSAISAISALLSLSVALFSEEFLAAKRCRRHKNPK